MEQLQNENIETNNEYKSYREEEDNRALVDSFLSNEDIEGIFAEEPKAEGEELEKPAEEVAEPQGEAGILKRVASDIGRGTIGEGPRSVASGVVKGLNQLARKGNEFNQAMGDVIAKGFIGTVGVGNKELTDKLLKRLEEQKGKRKDLKPLKEVTFKGGKTTEPESVTGNLIQGVSQFLTGFAVAGKVIGGEGFVANTIKSGFAEVLAFDEQEERLSDLVEKFPVLSNPLTRYMKSDPEDSKAEARFKQFLDSTIGDILTEPLFRGLKLLKDTRGIKKQATEEAVEKGLAVAGKEVVEEGLTAKNLTSIGNLDDENLILKKLKLGAKETEGLDPEQITKLGTRKPKSVDDIQINFARIDGPEDIKNAMQGLANETKLIKPIKKARRGVRTNEATLKSAQDIDGFETLLKRRSGQPLNAEQTTASRNFYYKTTDKLMELAKKSSSVEATDADHYAFRKMIAIHQATQKELLGARAEAGRSLQAWAIPIGATPQDKLKGMERILEEFGGADSTKELAQKLASFGDGNLNLSQINMITTKTATARTRDAMIEGWKLGLLTNPVTHSKNLISNISTSLILAGERYAQAISPTSPTSLKEANAFLWGIVSSQKEAFKNGAKALKTGQIGFGFDKVEAPFIRATSKDTLDLYGVAKPFAYAMDYYGKIVGTAGRALGAVDEYSKTVLYKSQIDALSMREGIEKGLKGAELTDYVSTLKNAPSDLIVAKSKEFALYGTFNKELGKTGKQFQRILNQQPYLKFAVPFVRTPANITKFTFERTPLALISKKVREDLVAGGHRQAQALARMGMGSSILMLGADMSLNGKITGAGPTDPKIRSTLRRTGWQPHSFKIGDKYISYQGVEPISSLFSMSADLTEIMTNYESYDIEQQEGLDNIVSASVLAFSDATINKTFLRGLSNVIEAMAMPEQKGERFLQRQLASFIPSGFGAVEKAVNPQMEYIFNIKDSFKSKIVGVSDSVAKRRNVYGEILQYRYPDENILDQTTSGVLSLFNPFYTSKEKDAPLDRFLLENGYWVGMPVKRQNFDGVNVDMRDYPEMYSRFLELRGQGVELIQYGNVNMKDALTGLVSGELPQSLIFESEFNNQEEKQALISKIVNDYGNEAKKQLRDEFSIIDQLILEDNNNNQRGLK